MARRLGRLPKFNDWAAARREDAALLTEWQVYRMFDARRGAWSTFQYLVRKRLREEGATVERDGSVKRAELDRPRARRAARGRRRLRRGARTAGSGSAS